MSMRAELEKVLSQMRYADETLSEAAEQDSICMQEDFLAKHGQALLALASNEAKDSATLAQLFAMFRQREQLGRAKYGTTVDRTDLTPAQWRQHHREELMDALLYSLAEEREHAGWRPIATAPEGVAIVVGWHEDGEFRNTFDARHEGCWVEHADHYDHFCAVSGAGMRGPKQEAPYTHWHPLAAAPEVSRG